MPSAYGNIAEIVLERLQVGANLTVEQDFLRSFRVTSRDPSNSDEARALNRQILTIRAELLSAALTPQVATTRAEVARVPAGRWQALLAAFGLPHRTRPVMADVRTEIKTLLPIGVSVTGLVDLRNGIQNSVVVGYVNDRTRRS